MQLSTELRHTQKGLILHIEKQTHHHHSRTLVTRILIEAQMSLRQVIILTV